MTIMYCRLDMSLTSRIVYKMLSNILFIDACTKYVSCHRWSTMHNRHNDTLIPGFQHIFATYVEKRALKLLIMWKGMAQLVRAFTHNPRVVNSIPKLPGQVRLGAWASHITFLSTKSSGRSTLKISL